MATKAAIEDVADALLPGGKAGSSADDCKDLGNSMLAAGKLEDAVWLYSLALEKRPGCHTLHSNRSAAYARMGYWPEALADADNCVKTNPEWARGHGRRGAALEGLKRIVDAKQAYTRALALEPENENTKKAVAALEAQIEAEGLQAQVPEESPADSEEAQQARKEAKAAAATAEVERLKGKGNKAFAASNFEDAVAFFGDAIALDKGNHVLYSNRSAAYCAVSQFGAALADAQKCLNLSPSWPKGYGRKAAALVGLGRVGQAVEAYRRGLQLDPTNPSLLQGLAELQGPPKTEVKEEVKEAGAEKTGPPPMDDADLDLLSEFLSETSHLERKQQVERIIKYRLNPFEVLQCRADMPDDEINAGYRKISLMVHPDKCQHPRAEEAFGICKKALAELQEEEKRVFYVEIMGAARLEAERELKQQKKKEREALAARNKVTAKDVDKLRAALLGGVKKRKREEEEEAGTVAADAEEFSKEEEDTLAEKTREAAYRILTQLEKRRARAEKVFIENDKRSKAALQEMKTKHNTEEKVEEQWNKDRLDRIDSWRDFQTHGKKMGIKKPKPSVTEKGVSVLPPTMGGIKASKEEQDLLDDFLEDA